MTNLKNIYCKERGLALEIISLELKRNFIVPKKYVIELIDNGNGSFDVSFDYDTKGNEMSQYQIDLFKCKHDIK